VEHAIANAIANTNLSKTNEVDIFIEIECIRMQKFACSHARGCLRMLLELTRFGLF